jgi:anti-anti-sigma factor
MPVCAVLAAEAPSDASTNAMGREDVMDGGHTESWRLDGVRIMALHGEHDLSNVASLRVELGAAIAASSAVVIDLTDAEFIDSTTLQALLRSHHDALERGLRFAAVVPAESFTRRLFDLVGLAAVVTTYATRAAAVAAVAPGDVADAHASA